MDLNKEPTADLINNMDCTLHVPKLSERKIALPTGYTGNYYSNFIHCTNSDFLIG